MADYLKEPTKENKQRLEKFGVTKAQLDAYMKGEEYVTEIGLIQNYRSSPSRIAEKVAVFRAFFRMGDRAMDKLVKLRDRFARKYDEALSFVKSKDEREELVQLLWDGDEEQKEFGKLTDAELSKIKADNPNDTTKAIQRAKIEKICKTADVSENVAKAYLAIRRQLERAYIMLDEARRRPQNKAAYLTDKQYEKLRDNKFVKQGTLKIHDTQDEDGKQVGDIIGTGKTQREAIKIAEQWQKNHQLKDGEQIYVLPHTFNFGISENSAPVMGDKDFEVMMNRIAQNTGLTLAEAKQIVNGAVKLKNRHRFLGQLLHRKGYKGYENDMDWVLRHHFNTVARYVALETEFKPKAISLFERVFGAFDKDHSKNLLAQYTKDFINDVNGNPAWIDEVINRTLNQNSIWLKYFLPNVGERGGKLTQSELRILNGSGILQDIGLDTASGYDKNRGIGSNLPVLKQLEVIADFLPQSKKTTFKQKAAFWIPYFFMCGLMGFLPFFDLGDKFLNEKFKLFPKDFLQKLVIEGTQEIFGKDSDAGKLVGKVIMYGAPALANVDISKRTGLASIMPQDFESFLLGATGSTIWNTSKDLATGNYANALRDFSPGLFNIYAATIAGETRDVRGRKVSAYEDMHDRIVRGMGFKSVDESLATDIQRINFNERDRRIFYWGD